MNVLIVDDSVGTTHMSMNRWMVRQSVTFIQCNTTEL